MSDLELENELLGSDDDSGSEAEVETGEHSGASRSPSPPSHAKRKGSPSSSPVSKQRGGTTSDVPSRRQDENESRRFNGRRDATPESIGSAAMSESEDEEQAAPAPTRVQPASEYRLDGVFIDEKDRADIMALPEVRREQILAERAEARQEADFVAKLRQKTARDQEEEKAVMDHKKRKAGETDLDDSPRKTARSKTNDRIEKYKRQREQQFEQRRRGEVSGSRRDRRSSSRDDRFSDADGDAESEFEWDNKPAKPASAPRNEPPAVLRDFQRVQIGRTNFARVCFTPGFEQTATKCFTKIALQPDPIDRHSMLYKMVEIRGIVTGKPYNMEGANGRRFQTDQYALVWADEKERTWAFTGCSDRPISAAEFEQYKADAAKQGQKIPTATQLVRKCDDIQKLIDHQWTDEEITQKLKRSGILQAQMAELNSDTLMEERQRALKLEDTAKVEDIDRELKKLDMMKSQSNGAAKAKTQQDRLAERNIITRKLNADSARRAQLDDRRREKELTAKRKEEARSKAAEAQAAMAAAAAAAAQDDDLFGDDEPVAAAAVASNGAKAADGKHEAGLLKKKKKTDDEVLADLELEIDIEV